MNKKAEKIYPQLGKVTVEFVPSDCNAKYTDDKKRSVLKIIFHGFENRKSR